jgi:hypothetical protein
VKLAFIGASGYGNIGDDTYPLVLREHLAEHHLIFYNSDLPTELPHDLSAVILGGGGLIYNSTDPPGGESHHFQCMQFYMDWAQKRGIPWGFLSCGVQLGVGQDAIRLDDFAPWTPWLQGARFITLRSPACVDVVRQLTGRDDAKFFPDLVYLYRPSKPPPTAPNTSVTFVPAGLVNPRNRFCNHIIRLLRAANTPIVWLGMAAPRDDNPHLDVARQEFPDAQVIAAPSVDVAYRTIASSRFVFTGRYHGMVFARTSRVPFYVPEGAPWKIRHETFDAEMRDAQGHLHTVREALAI